jgi:predicted AlkP superfamily pyrophosphatase or phosphodiesterase
MIDALREDFVEMPYDQMRYLDIKESVYKGRKLKLFNDLAIEKPQNTILLPLASEMPTVTMVRVKGMMTGGLSAYFELSDNFGSDRVKEDSVLQ